MNKKIILICIFALLILACKPKSSQYQRVKYECTDNQSKLSEICANNCDRRNMNMSFEECADTCMYIYCKPLNRRD